MFYDDRVREGLAVLADPDRQAILWNDPLIPETFGETYLGLFEDSSLGQALADGTAYEANVDSKLRELRALCLSIGLDRTTSSVLADPRIHDVRRLASATLDLLRGRPMGTITGSPLGPGSSA